VAFCSKMYGKLFVSTLWRSWILLGILLDSSPQSWYAEKGESKNRKLRPMFFCAIALDRVPDMVAAFGALRLHIARMVYSRWPRFEFPWCSW
jgi:hypothetical protein